MSEKNEQGLVMKYFILSPTKRNAYGVASRVALDAYAKEIRITNSTLADEIQEWVRKIDLYET